MMSDQFQDAKDINKEVDFGVRFSDIIPVYGAGGIMGVYGEDGDQEGMRQIEQQMDMFNRNMRGQTFQAKLKGKEGIKRSNTMV